MEYKQNTRIDYLKLINNKREITFDYKTIDPNFIFELIIYLRKNNCFNKVKIEYDDYKDKLFKFILDNKIDLRKLKNVYVGRNEYEEISIINFFDFEKRLYELIEPAEKLSPFEKYLFAYNLVKQYKEYRENDKKSEAARNLYDILDNDYIVCVGFTTFLNDLLTKLGIESTIYNVTVDIGLDKVNQYNFNPLDESISTVYGYHSRLIINLIDKKYGINGYYIADPTWDNDMQYDLYNHSLMTSSEEVGLKRYNHVNNIELENELLYCDSIEEFYSKVNFIIDRKINANSKQEFLNFINRIIKIISKYDQNFKKQIEKEFNLKKSLFSYSENEINEIMDYVGNYVISNNIEIEKLIKYIEQEYLIVDEIEPILKSKSLNDFFLRINYYLTKKKDKNLIYQEMFRRILELLKLLDKDLSMNIMKKFGDLCKLDRVYLQKEIQDILTYIGECIVAKTNNVISGEQYKEAITVLYRDIYKYPDYEKKVNLAMDINKKAQEIIFPKFIRESKIGSKTVIYNGTNKFDLEFDNKKLI